MKRNSLTSRSVPSLALGILLSLIALVAPPLTFTAAATEFRDEINLGGSNWQDAINDTINVRKIPANLKWQPAEVPTPPGKYYRKLKSGDHMWGYCNVEPEKLVNADGTFKITKDRSVWFKTTVDIKSSLLKNKTVHLMLAGASWHSGYFVNGKFAGESIQSTLPLDFDITRYLKPGKNEIVIAATTREGLIDPKARVYLAPSMGAAFGIRGPIRLEFRPKVAVEDVFVKTSVSQKNIDFQTTIRNSGSTAATVTPQIKVRSTRGHRPVIAEFTGKPIKISPRRSVVTNIKENWVAPILWSLRTPEMYVADVELLQSGTPADRYEQTFGFREFTRKGKDFLLNGKRVVMLRTSSLNGLKTVEANPEETTITRKKLPVNSIRQHLGCYNSDLIHRANQMGLLVVPESSYSWVHIYKHKPGKTEAWLPGTLEYFQRWVRYLRNEPSVVIYSLANETYWERTQPEEMAVAKKIVDVVRKEDPTRLLQADGDNYWGGLLDVINIHYPEGNAGTLKKKYPNAFRMTPNDLEWLTDGSGEMAWRAKFKWDRPLVIGEFGAGGDLEGFSACGGDSVYDWTKWQQTNRSGAGIGISDPERRNYYQDTICKMINFYRYKGVAGINPWTGDYNTSLKAIKVFPLDFHPNVSAGDTFRRKIAIVNDGVVEIHKYQYHLEIEGRLVYEKEIKQYVGTGRSWSGTIEIPIPDVGHPAKGKLTVRAFWNRNSNNFLEQDRHTEEIYIVPQINLGRYAAQVAKIDPQGSLTKVLGKLGLSRVASVNGKGIPTGTKLLMMGADAFKPGMAPILDSFVSSGGSVLMLPQKGWQPYRRELPTRDSEHATTQCWMRMPTHPALQDMHEEQFSFWAGDNVVSYETFFKPKHGPLQAVLDSGGRFGLTWSPLLDIPVDKGTYLMTTLLFDKGEPAARQLLANLIRYGCNRKPRTLTPLNVVAGSNQELVNVLKQTGVVMSQGVGSNGPVLVDASANINVQALKSALAKRRIVWLHGFTPKTLPKVASLLPSGSKLQSPPKGILGTMTVRRDDSLFTGVSTYDLAWYMPKMYYGGPLFDDAKVIAKAGDWVLDTNLFNDAVRQLTAPAYMVRLRYANSSILFDTLAWEGAAEKLSEKVARITSSILTNMDCEFRFGDHANYRYRFVDLSRHANMAYMDRKPNDGRGGWTDGGEDDMRFFLINHSGKGNGREDGMDIPVPDFPTKVKLGGVPCKLVDPKANGNKAVLSFGSSSQGPKLIREAKNIPVNSQADVLWFVHCIGNPGGKSGQAVAQYTVSYTDGTTSTIPIRRFVDVGDWHTPRKYSNADIAWTGKNLVRSPIGVNVSTWKNPHPEKKIKSLSVKAGLAGDQYVLLAVTCGKKMTP